jgi:hypothetical protein
MTRLNKQIITTAKCNVIDVTLRTVEAHKKDLTKRLKQQQKALVKTIEKGWDGRKIIEESIINIKITLEVLKTI